MTIDEIRSERSRLENEVGRLIRAFEQETGAQVGYITFGPVYAHPVGQIPQPQPVMARDNYDCLIELVL